MLCAGIGLFIRRPRAGRRRTPSAHSRASGNLLFFWIPAFAGMSGKADSRSDTLFAQRGGEFYRFDDLHVSGAAADVAAERFENFSVTRIRISPQKAGRCHDEAGRAVTTLRSKLFVEAALYSRELPVGSKRLDRVDALAVDSCCQRQARQRRAVLDQHRASPAFAAVASGFGAGEPYFFAQVIEQQNIVGNRIGAIAAVESAFKQPGQPFLPLKARVFAGQS